MPIRIDYSPVGTLMNLARSAGEAQGARESATHDLAFTQMAMQAQTQNAQIASTIRRNDQAFQLQRAALARQARTPTRAVPGVSPVAQEVDQVLQRQIITRGWEQQDVQARLQQIETMRATGQYTDKQIEAMKLGALGGRSVEQLIKEQKPEQVGLTQAQRESRTRVIHQNQRDVQESILRSLDEERQFEDWTPEKNDWQKRYDAAVKAIRILDVTYGAMRPTDVREDSETLDTPQPWPAKADAKIGQLYVAPNNEVVRWNGTLMVPIKKK